MGRSQCMTVLALGRSPYEPPEQDPGTFVAPPRPAVVPRTEAYGYTQRFDFRGRASNPESKARAKRLRRAKNDIFASMGILEKRDNAQTMSPRRREKNIGLLLGENAYGAALTSACECFFFFFTWSKKSRCARLQTFNIVDGISSDEVAIADRSSMGRLSYNLAGLPMLAASFLAWANLHPPKDAPQSMLAKKAGQCSENSRPGKFLRVLSHMVAISTHVAINVAWERATAFYTLQSLGLIPAWDWRSLRLLLPFASDGIKLLPSIPTSLSWSSVGTCLLDLAVCPLLTGYAISYLRPRLLIYLHKLLWSRVPKPDNPDTFSSLAAERYVLLGGGLPDYLRPSAISPEVPDLSLFQQVVHDLGLLRRRLVAQITGAFSGAVTTHGKKPFAAAPTAYETGGVLDAGEVVEAYHEVENAPVPRPLEETSSFDGFTELFSTELHEPDQGSQAMFDSSHSIEIGHVEINGDDSQELAATEEQPTEPPAPTTSLDRLEQGLPDNSTIPAPDDASSSLSPTVNGVGADGEPELNESLSNSTVDSKQLSELVKPNQEVGHRMTLLSCYPAESLCWQLSHTVVELLLHHLVSIHYRNVATYFLSTRPSRMAFFDGSPYTGVRPVFALCGGGSLSEKMKYFSDIMLLTGLRFLDRALLWHVVGCLTAISGVKKFEWWKLRAD